MITNARYADADSAFVLFTMHGAEHCAPVESQIVQDMLFDQLPIGAFVPRPPTADDVRAEAQRRIIALVGATSLSACFIKQLNALMRATELSNKGAANWTPSEAAEAAYLQGMADAVKAIRAASNVLEPNPPADFAADSYWPLIG